MLSFLLQSYPVSSLVVCGVVCALFWPPALGLVLVGFACFLLLHPWTVRVLQIQHERFVATYLASLAQSHEGTVVACMMEQGCIPRRLLTSHMSSTVLRSEDICRMLEADREALGSDLPEALEIRHCVHQVAQRLAFLHVFTTRLDAAAMLHIEMPSTLGTWLLHFMPTPQDRAALVYSIWRYLGTKEYALQWMIEEGGFRGCDIDKFHAMFETIRGEEKLGEQLGKKNYSS